MSELSVLMEAMKADLATFCGSARVVTRDARDPSQRERADLVKGVYTLLHLNERDYTNTNGYEAQDGRHRIILLGDFIIGEDEAPSKVEDFEGDMIDQIKAWIRQRPASLCLISLLSVANSGQIAAPNGWIVAELEYQT